MTVAAADDLVLSTALLVRMQFVTEVQEDDVCCVKYARNVLFQLVTVEYHRAKLSVKNIEAEC